jgi:hypothetical protein
LFQEIVIISVLEETKVALVVTVDGGLHLVQQESQLYKTVESVFTAAE